jgi:hypothetical protein
MNHLVIVPAHEVTSLAHGVTAADDMEASQDGDHQWERDAASRRSHDLRRWQRESEARVKFRI